jgi:hypothetical protein
MVSFPQASPPTPCAHLYPLPYAPHAQPISFFLILPPAQYWVRSTDHSAPHYVIFFILLFRNTGTVGKIKNLFRLYQTWINGLLTCCKRTDLRATVQKRFWPRTLSASSCQSVWNVVNQVSVGQVYIPVTLFSPVNYIPPMLHIPLSVMEDGQ